MTRTHEENAADTMNEEAVDRVLLTALRAIPQDHDSVYGICDWLSTYCLSQYSRHSSLDWYEELACRFSELAKEWPEFSGDDAYPVPCPPWNDITPRYAFHVHSDRNHMWNRDHPYGAARWRLVEWMIRNLEETL